MLKLIIIILFCIFVSLQVVGKQHTLSETFVAALYDTNNRDSDVVAYDSATQIIQTVTASSPTTDTVKTTMYINWNTYISSSSSTSDADIFIRLNASYIPENARNTQTGISNLVNESIVNIILPVNIKVSVNPGKIDYVLKDLDGNTDLFNGKDVVITSLTIELISPSSASSDYPTLYIDSISFVQEKSDKIKEEFVVLCDPFALCLEANLPIYTTEGAKIKSGNESITTKCTIPHTRGIHAWVSCKSIPSSKKSVFIKTSKTYNMIIVLDTNVSSEYTFQLSSKPDGVSGKNVFTSNTQTQPVESFSRLSSYISSPSTYKGSLDTDSNTDVTYFENLFTFKLSTTNTSVGSIINIPIIIEGLEKSKCTVVENDSISGYLLEMAKLRFGKNKNGEWTELVEKRYTDNKIRFISGGGTSTSTPTTVATPGVLNLILPIQISLLNQLDANELKRPFFFQNATRSLSGMVLTEGSSSTFNFSKILPKKFKDVSQPYLVSNMNAKGLIISLNNEPTGTIKTFRNILPGDGLLLHGCAKMTYNSMTRTTTNLYPYFKFTINLEDKTKIVFKFEKSPQSRPKSVTFTITPADSTIGYGFSDTLILNPHASDLSWVLQINKAGQFFFAINKNDTNYGFKSGNGILSQDPSDTSQVVLLNLYKAGQSKIIKQKPDAQGLFLWNTIEIDTTTVSDAVYNCTIITDYDTGMLLNDSNVEQLTNGWNHDELQLLPNKILRIQSSDSMDSTSSFYITNMPPPLPILKLPDNITEFTCGIYIPLEMIRKQTTCLVAISAQDVVVAKIKLHNNIFKMGVYNGSTTKSGLTNTLDSNLSWYPIKSVNGSLTIDQITSNLFILYCYYCGRHQTILITNTSTSTTADFHVLGYANPAAPPLATQSIYLQKIKTVQTHGSILSKAIVSMDANPNIIGGVLFNKQRQTTSPGGITSIIAHPSHGIRNINIENRPSTWRTMSMIPGGASGTLTSGPYTKDNTTCSGSFTFNTENCNANNAIYGRTLYKITDKTGPTNKCAITKVCNSTTTNPNMSLQNVYRNPYGSLTLYNILFALAAGYFEL